MLKVKEYVESCMPGNIPDEYDRVAWEDGFFKLKNIEECPFHTKVLLEDPELNEYLCCYVKDGIFNLEYSNHTLLYYLENKEDIIVGKSIVPIDSFDYIIVGVESIDIDGKEVFIVKLYHKDFDEYLEWKWFESNNKTFLSHPKE